MNTKQIKRYNVGIEVNLSQLFITDTMTEYHIILSQTLLFRIDLFFSHKEPLILLFFINISDLLVSMHLFFFHAIVN